MQTSKNFLSAQQFAVVVIGFVALAVAFSSRAALSLVLPVWQETFGWSASFISGVGAAALIVMAIIAPFAGHLIDRRGPRFVLALGLLLMAIGTALIAGMNSRLLFVVGFAGFGAVGFGIVATHVIATIVARNFQRNTGLATGIATSGATGGQFLVVPLIAALLAYASWRWSFGVLSFASLLFALAILFGFKGQLGSVGADNQDPSKQHKAGWRKDLRSILKVPAFHLLFWTFLLCGFTTTGVIEIHLLPFASFCGFPPLPSATAYGVLSGVNLLGMIAVGWLTDRVNKPLLLASIYGLRGVSFLLLGSLPNSSIETLYLFAVVFGAVDYSTIPVTASLVAKSVGLKVMGLAMGIISAGHAVGGALGAIAGGYVFDATGDYAILWSASVSLSLIAAFLALCLLKGTPLTSFKTRKPAPRI